MSNFLGTCAGCSCGGAGLAGCTHLRVTAVKRWNGYYPWNKNFNDVVETKYRRITVTRTIGVAGDYDACIYLRAPTQEELDNPDYRPITSYWCPYPGADGAVLVPLLVDGSNTPVNFTWIHPTFWRTAVYDLYQDDDEPVTRAFNCSFNWPPDYMADGCNRAPAVAPQKVYVTGNDCVDWSRNAHGTGGGCGCATDCSDPAVNMTNPPAEGFPCPAPESPWTCAGGANGQNLAEWAFNNIGAAFTEDMVTSRTISEDGLTLTVTYLAPNSGDSQTVVAVLSNPYSVTTALAEAEALLANLSVDRGNHWLTCSIWGLEVTLGCGAGQELRVGATEEMVCSGGAILQQFAVAAEAALLADVPTTLLSQRVWFDTLYNGNAVGLVVVSKSRIDCGAGLELCSQEATHPDDNFTVVYGASEDCATSTGEVQVMPADAPLWGRRMRP